MRTTQQLSITLPNDMADMVKTKVKAGEYASESEVIRDGLRVLIARDRAVEAWLHNQVGPACQASRSHASLPREKIRAETRQLVSRTTRGGLTRAFSPRRWRHSRHLA